MNKRIVCSLIVAMLLCQASCAAQTGDTETSLVTETSDNSVSSETEQSAVVPAPKMIQGRPESTVTNLIPVNTYKLNSSHEVNGRQGIAYEDGYYYVSGSTTLARYDSNWNRELSVDSPFDSFPNEVNHIGDIDVYDGEIYTGVEYFMDGEAKNIQIAVYDATSLRLSRTYPVAEVSGQTEVSGIAVDPDHKCIWMCSWADDLSGRYLYAYSLETGVYIKKIQLTSSPRWIQGIAYYDGNIYITSDDGDADLGEADHVYHCKVEPSANSFNVVLERTLDDVTLPGEIEGISFDDGNKQMLICYNRGAQIILGMPKGFYEGYDSEIHEVFVYDMEKVMEG